MTRTSDTEKSSVRTGGASRRLRWLLVPSLALNLLVVGAVIGHAVFDEPDRKVPRVDRIGGPLTFALSHDDRKEIGKALRQQYRQGRPTRAQIQEEYQQAITALRADPYDRAGLEAVFAAQLAGATERVAIGQRLLLERIAQMSSEERRAFADRLEEGLEHPERFGRPEKRP